MKNMEEYACSIYRPMTCQSWKILTAQYYSLVSFERFREEKKGCHWRIRGTGDLLYNDQHIHKESKAKRKNVSMRQIAKKTMLYPTTWMIDCLKLYKITDKDIKFITKTMKNSKVELIVIYEGLYFDLALGQMNGAPNETRTHSCRFASLTC